MTIYILLNISNLYADADARSMTPSRNTRSYTPRSVPSSPGRSFLISHILHCRLSQCWTQQDQSTVQTPSQGLVYWPCDESIYIRSLINPCYKSGIRTLGKKKHLPQMNLNAEHNPDMLTWSLALAHGPVGILLLFSPRFNSCSYHF